MMKERNRLEFEEGMLSIALTQSQAANLENLARRLIFSQQHLKVPVGNWTATFGHIRMIRPIGSYASVELWNSLKEMYNTEPFKLEDPVERPARTYYIH